MVISKYKIDFIKIGELLEFDVARELLEWVKELLYSLNVKSFPYSFDYAKEQWFRKYFTQLFCDITHDKDSMYWNQLNRGMEKLLEELCVIGKKDMKPHYKFTFADNGREANAIKYEMNELYFEGIDINEEAYKKIISDSSK